jgi:hypothetical protein
MDLGRRVYTRELKIAAMRELDTGFAGPPNPESYAFRREVIPVHDLKVRLNRDVKRVLLVPGEQELPVRRSGGTAEVVVPKLEMHSMLVVE